MTREALEGGRARTIERYGPWTANNIHLGEGVWTIGPGANGIAEERVQRVAQVVLDWTGGSVDGLRILDLGCNEGGFAIEFALRGAGVLAIDAREEHVDKTRFARDALGLDQLEVEHGDVRDLDPARIGEFDVVLCLGVLYHLDVPAAFELVERVARLTRRLAVIETQIGLTRRERVFYGGREYRGRWYAEGNTPGASVGNERSFLMTRASLLNALAAAGFTSVTEVLTPVIPELAAYRDHVTLVAVRAEPSTLRSIPDFRADMRTWPERLPRAAHPVQGPIYKLLDRLRRRRGGGLPRIFEKPAPTERAASPGSG
jgi:SAM-dependent methyltransferase